MNYYFAKLNFLKWTEKTALYPDSQTNFCVVLIYETSVRTSFCWSCDNIFCYSFVLSLLLLGLRTWLIVIFQYTQFFQVSGNEYLWKLGHLFLFWWVLLDSIRISRRMICCYYCVLVEVREQFVFFGLQLLISSNSIY